MIIIFIIVIVFIVVVFHCFGFYLSLALLCVRIKKDPRWHISSTFRGRQGRLPESGRRIPGCFQIVSKRYMGTE